MRRHRVVDKADRIDGSTRFLVIVGDPIAQVRSPVAFNARLLERGCNQRMIPWHAPAAAFEQVMLGLMATRNLDGIVITYPFKERALAFATTVSRQAAQVGAANALRREADGRWTADMFDGVGLVRALADARRDAHGRSVKLLGAGGAGRAIAFALADAGASRISIHDLDAAKAAVLAANLRAAVPTAEVTAAGPELDGAEILINATSVGLAASDALPVPLLDLTSATTVVDIVMKLDGTPLLNYARRQGCPVIAGAAMVEAQVETMLEFLRVGTRRTRSLE